MSGGHFNYDQYKIGQIADSIDQLIYNNNNEELDEYGDRKNREYTEATISEFRTALRMLRRAQIYAQRIDWLVSCDDGEDTFRKRLALDLAVESNNV